MVTTNLRLPPAPHQREILGVGAPFVLSVVEPGNSGALPVVGGIDQDVGPIAQVRAGSHGFFLSAHGFCRLCPFQHVRA